MMDLWNSRVRFHYGHPDVFDRIFHITRGGMSKASCGIHLSEDIFAGNILETSFWSWIFYISSLSHALSYAGFNSTLRRGNITHHEYIQVGKGRDVGLNQISLFEAKVACGNGEQILSRDVYRLGHRYDFFRMLSFYFTTIGFYTSSMVMINAFRINQNNTILTVVIDTNSIIIIIAQNMVIKMRLTDPFWKNQSQYEWVVDLEINLLLL